MSVAPRDGDRFDRAALRVCFDVNVWLAYTLSLANGRAGSVAALLVDMALSRRAGSIPLQIIMSHESLDTLCRVLLRQGIAAETAAAFIDGLIRLSASGPESLAPSVLLSGRDQFAMRDRENAGILAGCFAARADLLVTDNLRDFVTNDAEILATRRVYSRASRGRQLFALIHERADGVSLSVMHPSDALDWLRGGRRPTPDALRAAYPVLQT